MRRVLCLLLLFVGLAGPAAAREVSTRSWTDPDGTVWTETTTVDVEEPGGERLAALESDAPPLRGIARFGPFVVIDGTRAALVAETDSLSPARFAAMLRAFPGLRELDMADCPGTVDDTANLRLGRMIRASGIATVVPPGGSVRSGAVELFLAGTVRRAAPDAQFAVHAWEDEDGRQPKDYGPDAGPNRLYLDYYRAMGLADADARAFYALTNSVPNDRVLWLRTDDVRRFVQISL